MPGGERAAAFAAFSLLICSLRSRISDFFDSIITTDAGGIEFTSRGSFLARVCFSVPIVLGVASFASSTSPSSTSIAVDLEVDTPTELMKWSAIEVVHI
jgi:hypothetical protein